MDYPRSDYDLERGEWIEKYGSGHLKQLVLCGYSADWQYLVERAALEYPGFQAERGIGGLRKEADSPSPELLALSGAYPGVRAKVIDIHPTAFTSGHTTTCLCLDDAFGTGISLVATLDMAKKTRSVAWWRTLPIPLMAKRLT